MDEKQSDEALMLRYSQGDLLAFKELYARHSRGLWRFLAGLSPRRDWVEEIAQDSWINLHNARANYQPQSSFRTFLYQIARNRLIDIIRRPQLVLARDLDGDSEGESRFIQLADAQQDQHSPDTCLETQQRADVLHAAIKTLPNEQREALMLQQFSGMSLEEIASVTEVPVETIKSRLRYAMKKLRSNLVDKLASQKEQA